MSHFIMTVKTSEGGVELASGSADNAPRVGDLLMIARADGSEAPWLVTDALWTQPFNRRGTVQELTLFVEG